MTIKCSAIVAVALVLAGCATTNTEMVPTGRIIYGQDAQGKVVAIEEMVEVNKIAPIDLGPMESLCDDACIGDMYHGR